jgi:hypothetical protein
MDFAGLRWLAIVPGFADAKEFEARFSVTLPERPWSREVTEISISKRRS